MKTEITTRSDGPMHYIEVIQTDHTPHWQSYGGGSATIRFQTHDLAKHLSIDTTERSARSNRSKRTMVTLEENAARALYERLHALFGRGGAEKSGGAH